MRTVAVALVVVASAFDPVALALASPPEDLAAYCRATYPQVPFQIRCMSLERASQDRVAAARSAVDPTTWNRCQSGSPSWTSMEACLAQPTAGTTPGPGGAAGAVIPPGAPASEPTDEQARRQPVEGTAPTPGVPLPEEARGAPGTAAPPAAPPAPPPATASGSGSTIILGPQANPTLAAPPENRPTRPISEAEADRQLRTILERTGGSAARCTKRQYGPGWVIVCD